MPENSLAQSLVFWLYNAVFCEVRLVLQGRGKAFLKASECSRQRLITARKKELPQSGSSFFYLSFKIIS